ncbi:MAG: hypothetical protein ACYS74_10865 [Planctomycetota bacterium]|jgi:hypothetical protein
MKIKSAIVMLMAISFVLTVPAMAAKEPGDLLAPENVTVTITDLDVLVEWDEVENAVKYSVEVESTVTVYDDVLEENVELDLTVEVGTPVDESIEFTLPWLKGEVLAQLAGLGYDAGDIVDLGNPIVKVKALDPTRPPQKRQNNLFGWAYLFPQD